MVRPSRRRGFEPFVALFITAAVVVVIGLQAVSSPPSTEEVPTSATTALSVPAVTSGGTVDGSPPRPGDPPPGTSLATEEGELPAGSTVFDDLYPGIANLDPALLEALRTAAKDAAEEGVTIDVTSGWRSPAYQERLLREAIAEYGSAEEAARWVATSETSAHVAGEAVDIGPEESQAWLVQRGAAYGLCQIYANEPWHFELRPEAVIDGCPARYSDPTEDPRMQE
ncbi:MAG TPA: M15 family metallopeptidase [Acidimicrobiia bacterium]|jgi:D-alanyl-D-alanine carboxypeptidase